MIAARRREAARRAVQGGTVIPTRGMAAPFHAMTIMVDTIMVVMIIRAMITGATITRTPIRIAVRRILAAARPVAVVARSRG